MSAQASDVVPPVVAPPAAAGAPRTSLPKILVFALPAAGDGFMTSLVSFFFLKFATDVLLLAPGLMGLLFGLSRIWDAVSDPLVGYWSDRTRSRFGRRRPWIAGGAVPMALVFVALWAPPDFLTGSALVVWIGAAIVLFYTAHTAIAVPHMALGAELSGDHHDRTRIFSGRLGLDLTGVMLAAGALHLLETSAEPRVAAAEIAVLAGLISTAIILAAVARLRERSDYQGRGATSPYRAFSDVARNPHARVIAAVYLLETLGFATMTTVLPFATEYVLDLPGKTSVFLGSAIGVMLTTIPLWAPLSRRFGRRNLWAASTLARALAFGALFFAEPGALLFMAICVGSIGAAYGCGLSVGPSLQADVVDIDELATGQRKEGAYFACFNLAKKASGGLAIILAGFALQSAGFEPNVEQSDGTRQAIRVLWAGLPCVSYLLAGFLLLRLRLTDGEHARVRAALDERRSGDVG